ncbi:polyisoprenoid diphosphate/phosphate phosphohydrolase PLPP6 [Diabrotica undecimpunctata]|uniref:polyisoprenoid diphosphate/phosphate phosphohydrolase PLPP6 n=1 Tax=Diabrotica undecimpunctata TaxID=50387 RepID=UPI003B636DFC
MSEGKVSRVPPALQKILKYDAYITNEFLTWANKILDVDAYRVHCKALEISCHGIPWFAFWIAFSWLFNNPNLVQMQVNMLLGLITDIMLVAVAKAYFRRKRPPKNIKDDPLTRNVDIFSFPSGHASRAIFAAYFFTKLWPINFLLVPFLWVWSISVSLSRILMNRHYIMDVLGGTVLGIFNGLLIDFLWVEDSTAKWLFNIVSDEKLDGGEYHV